MLKTGLKPKLVCVSEHSWINHRALKKIGPKNPKVRFLIGIAVQLRSIFCLFILS